MTEAKTDIVLPGVQAKKAWAVDTMNGTEQALRITRRGNDTVLENLLLKDYPVFVRVRL